MPRFLEFLSHHPYLAGGAALVALTLAAYEVQQRIHALAALTAVQAVRLMNQGALVLDLRPREAFDAGHIGEARHVPAAELAAQADALKKWRDKPVIAYDDTGAGGPGAVRTLNALGFNKVFNLQGGVKGWVKDNLPLSKTAAGGKAANK